MSTPVRPTARGGEVRVTVTEPGRTALTLILAEPLVIGRDCEGLLLADGQCSRRHLELRPTAGGIEVCDLGSTNGTYVDGQRISGAVRVRQDAVIMLGSTRITMSATETRVRPTAATLHGGRQTSIESVAALAADAGIAAPDDGHRHGTVTIVFSDIEGSTSRLSSIGDAEWFRILEVHNRVVRDAIRRHGGTEVKNQGDGFMITFPSARRAVQAMITAQQALAGDALRTETTDLRIRVGMHTGEAIVDDDGDLFGHHVNVAARVAGAAVGGEILVSSLTKAILETRGDLPFGPGREVELKGLSGIHTVHPVMWHPVGADPTPPPGSPSREVRPA